MFTVEDFTKYFCNIVQVVYVVAASTITEFVQSEEYVSDFIVTVFPSSIVDD